MNYFIFLLLGISSQIAPNASLISLTSKKIVCYWQNRISASMIDPQICTHIIFAFINTNAAGEVFFTPSTDEEKLTELVRLKEQNTNLKIMISIANNLGVISNESRAEFADNVKNFLDKHNVDGVDIDWEWPAAQDRDNFVNLLRDLRKAISKKKILTIASAPCKNFASGYNIPEMLKEVDFFNVMLYNFHGGGWQNYTANHCNNWHPKSNFNLITCINYWISSGAPHEKMMIGIATHGRNFQLDDPEKNQVGALATFKNFGKAGEIPTTFSYNIICKNILENGWTRRYERHSSSGPYAFKGTTWTGYDDLESIRDKAVMVKKVNFGGVMFWSLDHDDHSNVCGDGKFPLIKSVWDVIMK